MKNAKIVVRCIKPSHCKRLGSSPILGQTHAHDCLEHQVRKLSMRLRTQELRTNYARKAAGQIGDRARTDHAVLVGIIWGLRNDPQNPLTLWETKADNLLAEEKRGGRDGR